MLRVLGRALSEAIADSSEVTQTLRKIRREGYTLYLLVDCKKEDGRGQRLPVAPDEPFMEEPVFRINGHDLFFLRSIGIDPTRSLRRRRKSR